MFAMIVAAAALGPDYVLSPRCETLLSYSPAKVWTEAYPLGNGHLGAMHFGGIQEERFQLNESTLWSGGPAVEGGDPGKPWVYRDRNYPDARAAMLEARRALFEGRNTDVDRWVQKMQGPYTESYLPMGDLKLVFPPTTSPVEGYRRTLELHEATTRVTYKVAGVEFTREAFISYPTRAMYIRLKSPTKGQISFRAVLSSKLKHEVLVQPSNRILLTGRAPSHVRPSYLGGSNAVWYDESEKTRGMLFSSLLDVTSKGGKVIRRNDSIEVVGADEAVLVLCAESSFKGPLKAPGTVLSEVVNSVTNQLNRATLKTFDRQFRQHRSDYRKLYDRCRFTVSAVPNSEETVALLRSKENEDVKAALLFNFGRYLMIAGSRPDSIPLSLQGIWNDELRAPWSSNYTININTEMNYWPAETANLAECHQPLLKFLESLAKTGAKTARINYGAKGWVAHHNSDLWAVSNPVGEGSGDPVWANWTMGGAWLSRHLFEHYRFNQNKTFLRKSAYPLMKGAAEFCLDFLIEDPRPTAKKDSKGRPYLVTAPSVSPELGYLVPRPDGKGTQGVSSAIGASMDMQIIWDLFTNILASAKDLGIEDDFVKRVRETRERVLPPQIGSRGQIMEWADDLPEAEKNHRHLSHLFAAYPGDQISPETTPKLAAAVRRTLDLRGDEATGWAMGWRLCLWARLHDSDRASGIMRYFMRLVETSATNMGGGGGVYPNLFDAHPPFQIDGNFAFTAGVIELVMQSHQSTIHLLPALPKAWGDGRITGIRTRGGHEVTIVWTAGKLKSASLKANQTGPITVRCGTALTVTHSDKALAKSTAKGLVTFEAQKGETYTLTPNG